MSVGFTTKPIQQLLRERDLLPGQKVQVFVDHEAVRLMAPYTPFLSGTLRDSVYVSTRFGSGEIKQNTPYARRQYYDVNARHRGSTTHHWFEAMKANGGKVKILNAARRMSGAKT